MSILWDDMQQAALDNDYTVKCGEGGEIDLTRAAKGQPRRFLSLFPDGTSLSIIQHYGNEWCVRDYGPSEVDVSWFGQSDDEICGSDHLPTGQWIQ